MPPTGSSPPNTRIIDPAIKDDFKNLLLNFQKARFAQIAYNKFVGASTPSETDAEYYQNNNQANIDWATDPTSNRIVQRANDDSSPVHITTLEEAKIALGEETHYLDNRTKFREAGIITGLDPERVGYDVTTRDYWLAADDTQPEDIDLEYNTGVDYRSQSRIKREYAFIDTTDSLSSTRPNGSTHRWQTPGGGYRNPTQFSFFATPAILQYLTNQAWQLSRGTPQTTGAPATPPATATAAAPARVLIIGDSQTGNHVGPATPPPAGIALKNKLPAALHNIDPSIETYVVSQNGWGLRAHSTGWTGQPSQDIQDALNNFKPTVVVVQLGGNDSRNAYDSSTSKSRYHGLMQSWMDTFTAAGVSDVRWLGPSYTTKTYSWVDRHSDQRYENARQIIRDWVEEKANNTSGLTYYDTVAMTQGLTSSDGLHFIGASYTTWATALTSPGAPLDPSGFPGATTVLATPTVPSDIAEAYQQLALLLAQDAHALIKAQADVVEYAETQALLGTPQSQDLSDWAVLTFNRRFEKIPTAPWLYSAWATNQAITVIQSVRDPNATPELVSFGSIFLPGQAPTPPGSIVNSQEQLFYANVEAAQLRPLVNEHLEAVMTSTRLETYRNLIEALYDQEGVPFPAPGTPEYDQGVEREMNSILAFFGVAAPDDPLPDRPAAERIYDIADDSAASLATAVAGVSKNLTPFDMQCYLMENIEELVQARNTIPAFRSNYQHTMKVKSTSASPAMTTNILQNGAPGSNKSKRAKEILNLCPEVYASLVPSIRIYRVEYDKNGKMLIDSATRKPIERELVIPNFLDPADVTAILDGTRGRIPGAGIKSFSWSLEGVQPEEVDNNITAELVIYFQTINDFFRGASQAGDKEPNFLDLLINSPAVQKARLERAQDPVEEPTYCGDARQNQHRRYDGANYRIKVVAGWSAPDNLVSVMPHRDPKDIEALQLAIEQTKVSLFLQQVRHNLDFNEDGSLEMRIDYQASLAGLLTSPKADIFAPDSAKVTAQIEQIDRRLEDPRLNRGDASTQGQLDRREALLEEKQRLLRQNKLIKYRKLLQGLVHGPRSKVHNLLINPAEFLLTPWNKLTPEQRAARAKRRLNPDTGTLEFSSGANDPLTLIGAIAAEENGTDINAAEEYSARETERYDNLLSSWDSVSVPFFYLGDLIDNVMGQMEANNGGEKIHFDMFLSDADIINPLVAFQVKDLEQELLCGSIDDALFMQQLKASDPQTFTNSDISNIINIGDIPISVDAFQLFFKNKVVKPGRDTYYFLYFIKQLCGELVTRALGKTCFGLDLSLQQRFDAQPIAYDNKVSERTWFRPNDERSCNSLARQTDILPSTPAGDVRQALILLPTDGRPRDLKGDYANDFNRGIYHHYIGASCGLLKTLKFSREDQPHLREAKIQREGALGAEQLRELYSANLDLVGNNLYKNGMYIYINPTLLDADADELDYLGLHGYYFVTAVNSNLTPDGFDTNIRALHQAIAFNQPSRPLQYYDVAAETPPPEMDWAPEYTPPPEDSED